MAVSGSEAGLAWLARRGRRLRLTRSGVQPIVRGPDEDGGGHVDDGPCEARRMSDAVTVRPARVDDLPRLVAIDDEASVLYVEAGLRIALDHADPFVVAEVARWEAAIGRGHAWVAADALDRPLGFAIAGVVDGEPYLDQLAVDPAHMRRGLGRRLIARVRRWALDRGRALWLTTYDHLSFNRPYYERFGFEVEPRVGPELAEILDAQRAALPAPERRVAMRLAL